MPEFSSTVLDDQFADPTLSDFPPADARWVGGPGRDEDLLWVDGGTIWSVLTAIANRGAWLVGLPVILGITYLFTTRTEVLVGLLGVCSLAFALLVRHDWRVRRRIRYAATSEAIHFYLPSFNGPARRHRLPMDKILEFWVESFGGHLGTIHLRTRRGVPWTTRDLTHHTDQPVPTLERIPHAEAVAQRLRAIQSGKATAASSSPIKLTLLSAPVPMRWIHRLLSWWSWSVVVVGALTLVAMVWMFVSASVLVFFLWFFGLFLTGLLYYLTEHILYPAYPYPDQRIGLLEATATGWQRTGTRTARYDARTPLRIIIRGSRHDRDRSTRRHAQLPYRPGTHNELRWQLPSREEAVYYVFLDRPSEIDRLRDWATEQQIRGLPVQWSDERIYGG